MTIPPNESGAARGSARLLSAAMHKAATLARKHREAMDELVPLLLDRYGILPNDVDCDSFIDATGYGHGGITVKELDDEMKKLGYPPNTKNISSEGAE